MKLSIWMVTCIAVLAAASASQGAMITLYDGTLGTEPTKQEWQIVLFQGPLSGLQSWANNVTTLSTTGDLSYRITYATSWPNNTKRHPSLPATLDRDPGYNVRFKLQLTSETHTGNDDAGYNVIAMSSDNVGIELGFWDDSVWAYDYTTTRVHAEGTTGFDPTASLTTYDLTIKDDNYTLWADGTKILSGALRDYSAEGQDFWRHGYCDTPNALRFGDDCYNGWSVSQIGYIGIETFAVPEPATGMLVLLGAGLVAVLRRARQRR